VPTGKNNSSRAGLIVGTAVGVSVLVLLLLCAAGYAYRQKKRAEKAKQQCNPFGSWQIIVYVDLLLTI